MGRTACTEPHCLYMGALYIYLFVCEFHTVNAYRGNNILSPCVFTFHKIGYPFHFIVSVYSVFSWANLQGYDISQFTIQEHETRYERRKCSKSGPGSLVGIATGYGLDGLGIESRWAARFSTPVQTCPWGPPSLPYSGYRVCSGGKAAVAWR
jgi:hypothetical protein